MKGESGADAAHGSPQKTAGILYPSVDTGEDKELSGVGILVELMGFEPTTF